MSQPNKVGLVDLTFSSSVILPGSASDWSYANTGIEFIDFRLVRSETTIDAFEGIDNEC